MLIFLSRRGCAVTVTDGLSFIGDTVSPHLPPLRRMASNMWSTEEFTMADESLFVSFESVGLNSKLVFASFEVIAAEICKRQFKAWHNTNDPLQ